MKELDKIRKRIDKRKGKIDLKKQVEENESKKGYLFKTITSIMTIYVLFMSFAIYAKKDQNALIFNNIFNTNVSFVDFNKTLNKLLDLRIVDNSNSPIHDQVVSSESIYIDIGEDYYINDSNLAIALDDGIVTYVNGKDDNYTVIVEYNSGFRATYNNVNEVNVFVNDRIYKDDIIGSFIEKVEIIFIRNSEKITYEEVLALI